MKLTLVLTLLTVGSSFSWRLPSYNDVIVRLNDENSVTEKQPIPSIDFTGDWEETVHGELSVGREFKINYDGSRLPGRPTMYGQPAWSISVEYKFNHGPEFESEKFGAADMIDGREVFSKTIFIPVNASNLIIWFKHWSYYGGNTYDSNYGSNYEFPITVPSIVFEADWDENVNGELKAGVHFDVYYDSKRLKEDANIVAQMKFENDGDVITKDLDASDDTSYQTAVISIPDDAEIVEMWFYYENEDGEKQYDSDYGENYRFELSE